MRRFGAVFFCLLACSAPSSGEREREVLSVLLEAEESAGLAAGDPVRSADRRIGEVGRVALGPSGKVEIELRIGPDGRDSVREGSAFRIVPGSPQSRPAVEHYVLDPTSPPARPGRRFQAVQSLADIWLRRGRIEASELSELLARGLGELRENLQALRRSPEWAKFRDQLARLAAELTVAGSDLSRLLERELPAIQQDLLETYRRYLEELERRRPPAGEST